MPISPEQKRVVPEIRKLAGREQRKDVAALVLRRADLIEAGEALASDGERPMRQLRWTSDLPKKIPIGPTGRQQRQVLGIR
jgi:hypothetical protein